MKPKPDPKLHCECGAYFVRLRVHANKCAIAKAKYQAEAEVKDGDRHAEGAPLSADVHDSQGDPATSEPEGQGSSSESTDDDEDFVTSLRIKFGSKDIPLEVAVWVFRTFGK